MNVFSAAEMARRIAKLREEMAARDLTCMIATSYAGSYYLSAAPIHPFGRPMATIIPRRGDAAMIVSVIEEPHVRCQSWIKDVRTYYDYNLEPSFATPTAPPESFARLVAAAAADRGSGKGRIAYENAHLPVAHYEALHRALPDAELVGFSHPFDRLRAVLSEEELRLVRSADAIADLGLGRLIDMLRPGRTALELTAACRASMTDAILDRHRDMPFHMHVNCGLGLPERSAGHSEWTTWGRDAAVVPGQLLELVVSVFLWGYWGNVERTVFIGTPDATVRKGFDVMVEANEAAIAAIRPSMPLRRIDEITKEIFGKHGFGTRTGSGCGRGIVSYEANARELAMDLRLYADLDLQPGMAFSLEPDLDIPEIGTFRHCNTIIVTPGGCEVDSRLPRGPILI